MISFIVIGKNIERTIKLCLDSIFNFVKVNKIECFEIIYVDSDSNDNTITIAKNYPIRIFQIRGEANAAIGRNVGAKHSKGEILFFIDGDMELVNDFYEYVFDKDSQTLKYPFVNGYLIHKFYDSNFTYQYDQIEKIPDQAIFRDVTGGLMIVEKKLWQSIGGMDERLIRNQDLDFGLRLSKSGYPALLDNHLFAIHHTIAYTNKSRALGFYFSKSLLSTGLLMRKHLFELAYLKRHYQNVFYVLLLFTGFILFIIKPIIGIILFGLYLFIQISRTIRSKKKEIYFFSDLMFKIMYNFYSVVGLLFYYPKKSIYDVKEIEIANNQTII